MKIHVITDNSGNILGTMQAIDGFDASIVPLPGQNVYELELPMELAGGQEIDQLHKRLMHFGYPTVRPALTSLLTALGSLLRAEPSLRFKGPVVASSSK